MVVSPTRTSSESTATRPGVESGARLSAFGALGALPGLVFLLYGLGGVTFAVQAGQAGLPWMAVLSATPTQTLLARGVLPVFTTILLTPLLLVGFVGAQRVEDWWKASMSEHKLARIATGIGGVLSATALVITGAGLAAALLSLILLLADDVVGLWLPGWVRIPMGVVAVIGGGWFAYRLDRQPAGEWNHLTLSAKVFVIVVGALGMVMLILVFPFFLGLLILILTAGSLYFGPRLPNGRFSGRFALSRPFVAFLVVLSLADALTFATTTKLELERVRYGAAPDEAAGLISANAEEVVVAVCLTKGKQVPTGVRLWRVPRSDIKIVKVGGKPFLVEGRTVVTVADVMFGNLSVDRSAPRHCG